ncbi:MAG: hypothetical protein ABW360_00285 [Phenylobacterium sp.]
MAQPFQMKINPRLALAVSGALYVWSLALDALRDRTDHIGFEVLAMGWMGVFTLTFAWYGNLFWLAGAIFLARGKAPPLWVCLPGLLLAATCLLGVTVGDDSGTYPATLLAGAYVWLASFLPQIAATLTAERSLPRSRV